MRAAGLAGVWLLLLAAASLTGHGDFDLTNHYDERAWAEWSDTPPRPSGEPTLGRLHEPQGIGVAVATAPAYALGGARAADVLIAAVTALLTALLVRRWKSRPRPAPVVPPKLPWIAALEELDQIRRSSLLADQRTAEYFDRVSDCVRKYLGARYGFDGLETTTDEMREILRRVYPPVPVLNEIGGFLADCDLVKFARVVPAEDDCLRALTEGETIVRRTIPPPVTAAEEARAR